MKLLSRNINPLIPAVLLAALFMTFSVNAEETTKILQNVESYDASSEGRWHVEDGATWNYNTDPPAYGPHASVPVKPGFYEKPQAAEMLVHSLEHSNIVIYYDKPSQEVLNTLKKLVKKYPGRFDGVIVNPKKGLESSIIFTAWTKILRMDSYDNEQAQAFMDAYRGKGPERVR